MLMKFLQCSSGSLINTAHIEHLNCSPRYATKDRRDILTHWTVEVILSSGGGVDLGRFDCEEDAKKYLADLVAKLNIEVIK